MVQHRSNQVADRQFPLQVVPWKSVENQHPSVFTSAEVLLLSGGGLLFIPIVGELVPIGGGIGPTSWMVLPIIGLVSLNTLAIGVSLHQGTEPAESSG